MFCAYFIHRWFVCRYASNINLGCLLTTIYAHSRPITNCSSCYCYYCLWHWSLEWVLMTSLVCWVHCAVVTCSLWCVVVYVLVKTSLLHCVVSVFFYINYCYKSNCVTVELISCRFFLVIYMYTHVCSKFCC